MNLLLPCCYLLLPEMLPMKGRVKSDGSKEKGVDTNAKNIQIHAKGTKY